MANETDGAVVEAKVEVFLDLIERELSEQGRDDAGEAGPLGSQLARCAPLRRALEVVAAAGCEYIEVEPEYYCRDFMSEHAFLYDRIVEAVPRWTQRLHFWRSDAQTGDDYLGYTVLRPLRRWSTTAGARLGLVGRTALRYEIPGHYITCSGEQEVHIGSREYRFRGVPFIQQDSQVMCCAHAAMWVANRVMRPKCPTIRDHYPHEIAEMATERVTRGPTLPTGGLYAEQMLSCIQRMGFEPLYYDFDAAHAEMRAYADGIIYRYMESGLPVIVLTSNHAMCVVGHTFDPSVGRAPGCTGPNADDERAPEIQYLTPTCWIPEFIVHDDARGPYCLLSNRAHRAQVRAQPGSIGNMTLQDDVRAVIVPLPKNILLTGEEAETRACHRLYQDADVVEAMGRVAELPGFLETDVAQAYVDRKLVLRTYLQRSDALKQRFARLAAQSGGAALGTLAGNYASTFMSRYVWVVEISTPSLFAAKDESRRLMVGEVIADTTSSKYASPEFAIHVPGFLLIGDPQHPLKDDWRIPLPSDEPYAHRLPPDS